MLRSTLVIAVSVLALACAKDKKTNDTASTMTGSGSATVAAGSGSADTGSAATGSGSAAGSGSDTGAGSGSAMVGSGSDAGSAAGSGSALAGTEGQEGAGSAGAFDFDKLDHDAKVQFMKTKVMPAMKPAFQKFDPKKFASFTCKTCHGKDPQKSKFEMPTADLPVLDFAKIKAGKVDPEALEFMNKVVKPEMAKLLNQPEMTETQKGFGCLECHTAKK